MDGADPPPRACHATALSRTDHWMSSSWSWLRYGLSSDSTSSLSVPIDFNRIRLKWALDMSIVLLKFFDLKFAILLALPTSDDSDVV